jgi:putative membrane protein
MKKLVTTIFVSAAFFAAMSLVNAQMMGSNSTPDDHTTREEAEGKAILEKLQAKQTACTDLSDDDFGALGEYFMGQMMGGSHSAMNQMMVNMMGEEGEKQMHIVMGKRLSRCDTSATFPSQGVRFMPMMQMMMGGWSSPFGFNPVNNSMMNFGYGFGLFGLLFMLSWWVLIIVAVIALLKWLVNQFKGGISSKTALDILKERYAKGEIDKKEFEEKKKELS